jgi:hypothetical protein
MDEFRLCKQCDCVKPLEYFYVSNLARCKECVKASVRANRAEKIEYYTEYEKSRANLAHRVAARAQYAKTDAGKAAHKSALLRSRQKFPGKSRARSLLWKAIIRGKIKPHPCWVCGEKAHGHHPDYDRPLEVVWLCAVHHKAAHAAAA